MSQFSISIRPSVIRGLALLFLSFLSFSAYAQTITVRGQVLFNQLPTAGIPVVVGITGGVMASTFTDSMGNYSVLVAQPFISQGTVSATATCPTGAPVTNSVPFNPVSQLYTINIGCGMGGAMQTIYLYGSLLDTNGTNIAGLPVQFHLGGPSNLLLGSTTTQGGGWFADTLLVPTVAGGATIVASGPCLLVGGVVRDTMSYTATTTMLQFAMQCTPPNSGGGGGARFAVVSGTVVDAIGLPLTGIPVQVLLGAGQALIDITDSIGYYSVSGSFPSSTASNLITVTALCATSPVTATATYSPNVQQYTVNLTCGGGGSVQFLNITGTLTGPSGSGLAGQTVQFQNALNGAIVGSTVTQSGGFFADTLTVPLNPAGLGMLIAIAPCGNGTVTRDTVSFTASTTSVNFQMTCSNSGGGTRNITVSGIVSSNVGAPLSNVLVMVVLGSGAQLTDFTDSSGYYSVTGIFSIISPSTAIVVTAQCASGPIIGNATYSPNITNYTVNLTCGTGGGGGTPRVFNLQGTLTDANGNGLAGVQVRIFQPGQTLPLRVLTTGTGGFFSDTISLTPSSTLSYLVASAFCTNGTAARDTASLLPTTQTIVFQLTCGGSSGARLNGMVMGYQSRSGGLPDTLEVIVIQVTQPGTPQAIWTPIDTLVVADSAGFAPFQTIVVPGAYSVLAILRTGNAALYLPTYYGDTTTWSQALTLMVSNMNSFMVIDLMETLSPGTGTGGIGGGVGGTLPRLANPLTGIWVQLLNAQQNRVYRSVSTNAQGAYSFNNLPFGTYYIRCEYPGEHSDRIRVDLTATSPVQTNHSFSSGPAGFSIATGIGGPSELPRLLVYPNPVTEGRLRVACASGDCSARWMIRDLSGRSVLSSVSSEISESSIDLDVRALAPGMYTLEWLSASGLHLGRFVVY
jgi:phosphatidate phosphatase APP1